MSKDPIKNKQLKEIRDIMKRQDDFMAMELPRDFAATLEEIYKEKGDNVCGLQRILIR